MSTAITIDDVIDRLQGLVTDAIAAGDRMGYFAALYLRVTLAVREGIAANRFDDGPRMEHLDVLFANRYLAAHDQYRSGEMPSRAWLQAFRATTDPDHIVLQNLLIGMNAHINLDLGIASARTAPGSELAGLEGDFNRINDILGALTPTVERQIDDGSKDIAALSALAPHAELHLVGQMMTEARREAWAFAGELATLDPMAQIPVMARRDDETVALGAVVLHEGLLTGIIRKRESQDVARNIQLLASGEFGASPSIPPAMPPGVAGIPPAV